MMVFLFMAITPKAKPQVIEVPVIQTKVIEKPVIVKVPVKMSANDQQQVKCMADNIYFEAGNQSDKGKIAVSNVVMNRTKDSRFSSTPCGVVKQKRGGVCQFSWVCSNHKVIRDAELYAHSKQLAMNVYLHNIGDVTHGAKFYHANYVHPSWSHKFARVTTIGAHIFYRDA
jgi:spore germination cell wall hydrolase CwlJ-like protein